MNNLRKIGLSALAGSLATFSVNAADMSVSGAGSISFDDTNRGKADRGNGFYMGDSLKFNASGETDNGIGVAVYYEIDGGVLDDHNLKLSGDFGTITFDGHGGSSAMGAVDDKTPNAYEEAWDIIDTDGTSATGSPTVINGSGGGDGMWIYNSPNMGGAVLTVAYRNHVSAAAESMTDFALALSPEGIDGLTLGVAMSNNTIGANVDSDESTMYATYATGGFTFGLQASDLDHTTATSDQESIAYGVTYAVNDDLSIGYSYHELETELTTDEDQKSTGISASYTMGGMTLAGASNDTKNIAGTATRDHEGYEFTLSFAF
jgi:outer membrane protein OmpU|tara:strand:+ start:207 stop:1163 length:957 start_codon:yes stop_codon:yes gene_type:complete